MPSHVGRNPQSYPPNDKYRDNWDRMFGKGKKPPKASSGAELLASMSNGARDRHCDGDTERDAKSMASFLGSRR